MGGFFRIYKKVLVAEYTDCADLTRIFLNFFKKKLAKIRTIRVPA